MSAKWVTGIILVTVFLAGCAGEVASGSDSVTSSTTSACSVGAAEHLMPEDATLSSATAVLHNEHSDDSAVIVWVAGKTGAAVARVICDQPETVTFTWEATK